jgi:3,4-dihydroxy 2-butanone 4-phosphate synthase
LAKLAGITPVVAICEMLDSKTYGSLSIDEANIYAAKANIPLLESNQLKTYSVV